MINLVIKSNTTTDAIMDWIYIEAFYRGTESTLHSKWETHLIHNQWWLTILTLVHWKIAALLSQKLATFSEFSRRCTYMYTMPLVALFIPSYSGSILQWVIPAVGPSYSGSSLQWVLPAVSTTLAHRAQVISGLKVLDNISEQTG